jgi:DNA-binding transcriptional ArsR family regulator
LRKRVKVEFQDDKGTKYTLAVEGRVSREKVLKIMDLMELVEGENTISEPEIDNSTSFGKLSRIIEESYAGKEFSSADIARDFEEQQGEHIRLSTVSTYLSRLSERGVLKRQKFGNSWVYRKIYLQSDQLPSR